MKFKVRQVWSSSFAQPVERDWVIADGKDGPTTTLYWNHTTSSLQQRFNVRDCSFRTKEEAEATLMAAKLRGDI